MIDRKGASDGGGVNVCVIFSQVDVVAEYRKREESGKPQVNLVVIGECLLVWGCGQ